MAFPEIKKEVTYKIPNERFGMDDSEGKTSKMTYTGPSELVLWMDKETHKLLMLGILMRNQIDHLH